VSRPVNHRYVILALKRRYAVCKGQLGDLLCDRAAIKADMAHLGAVLAMFEPGIDLDAIRAVRPYKAKRGRWNRTAMEILREANAPMRGRELARRVMLAQGLEPDFRTVCSIEASLQAVLLRLAAMGLVKITGKPRRWAIARAQ
jgi:hypothetical protein